MRNYLRLLLAAILMSIPCLEVCARATLTKDAAGIAAGHFIRSRAAYRDAGATGEGVLWDFSGVDFSSPGHKVVCEGDTLGRYRVTGDRMTATHTAELVALHHRFYIKDHLGNNRRVIDMDGNVLQQTDYYPFGTPHADNASSTSADLQPYKYNGKELDGVHGLNTLDYGARQYHAAIPRWDRVDPLCEKYYHSSPYAYCDNNPINAIDMNVKEWEYITNDNGNIKIILNIYFSIHDSFSNLREAYKEAFRFQFNNTLEMSSGGKISGDIFFKKQNEVMQSISFGKMNGNIGGMTFDFNSMINLYNYNGELRSANEVSLDAIHEVLHTLRLGHPFEITQSPDTKLIRLNRNSFQSTSTTDSKIVHNIMNYLMIMIDGNKSSNQYLLTAGQLKLMLTEIDLQRNGYGFKPSYNSKLTPQENIKLLNELYDNYWNSIPGTPVNCK